MPTWIWMAGLLVLSVLGFAYGAKRKSTPALLLGLVLAGAGMWVGRDYVRPLGTGALAAVPANGLRSSHLVRQECLTRALDQAGRGSRLIGSAPENPFWNEPLGQWQWLMNVQGPTGGQWQCTLNEEANTIRVELAGP